MSIPTPFKWNETFDVEHKEINDQHKVLFDMIDHLDKNRTDAKSFSDLVSYVLLHFKTEEDLFAKFHYDDSVEHKKTHEKLVSDVSAVKSIGDGEISFLKNWLVGHIMHSDMKYKGKVGQ